MGRKVLVDAIVIDMVTVMVTTMGIPFITATQNK
ncbi:hypothetical protein PHVU103714_20710 [Phocaeicola vulgatus]